MILLGLLEEDLLQLFNLLRVLGREVGDLRIVLVEIVELPGDVVERIRIGRAEGVPWGADHLGREHPAILVDRVVAHHLEVLDGVVRRRIGVLLVEGIGEAGAFDRCLLDAIHLFRRLDLRGVEDGRHDVDHMGELIADAAHVRDVPGPRDGHALTYTTQMRSDLLEPAERRVEGPGPGSRHVRIGQVGAPHVVELHLDVDRKLVEAIEEGHFVGRAHRPALGTRAIVAVDVDDQRVVELAHVIDRLDDAADLMVGVGGIGGEHLDLADEQLLFFIRRLVPRLQQVRRPGRELRILRDDAELLLVGEDRFTELFIAAVEQVHGVDLVHPLLGGVMRRMGAARHIVDEERLVGCGLVQAVEIVDGVIRHARRQVPAGLALEGEDLRGVAEQVGLPLVGVAADEAIEILEPHADRPLVEGTCHAGLEGRRVVILAEPRGGIAIVLQDAADGGLVLADDRVVAGEARRLLGDHAEARRVVVASGDQGRTGGRAQRRRVHVGVAQPRRRHAVKCRRGNDATEGRGHAVTRVVGHDEQHIGRALGRHDTRRPPWLGLQRIVLDDAAEGRGGCRQLLAADRHGGAGCTHGAVDLLGRSAAAKTGNHPDNGEHEKT